MTEPKLPPSVLLDMMAKLEAELVETRAALAAQKAAFDDLHKTFTEFRFSTNSDLIRHDDQITEIDMQMMNVVGELFPAFGRTQVQIGEIFERRQEPDKTKT